MKKFTFLTVFFFLAVLGSYSQWSTTYLSTGTLRMGGAVLAGKAYFAGGLTNSGGDTDKVEIYNTQTGLWSIDYLSQARQIISATTCGGFIFFAGGLSNWIPSSRVDMFNELGLWESKALSIPRFALSVTGKDNIVLFAGGGSLTQVYDVVDIYNITSGQWNIDHISMARTSMGCAVAGDMAFFAGGGNAANTEVYDRVDIYHFSTGTWDTATLSQARSFPGATVAQGKVIFAGGSLSNGVPSGRVDVYDTQTGTWDTVAPLSVPRAFYSQSATVCGLAYFVGSGIFGGGWNNGTDTVDVYDPIANTWSVMTLPNKVTENAVVVIDSTLFSAGGFYENNPPYGVYLNTVEMFKDSICSWVYVGNAPDEPSFTIYPNPCQGSFSLKLSCEDAKHPLHLHVYNLYGQEVHDEILLSGDHEMNMHLPAGVYFYRIRADKEVGSGKLIIR